MADSFLDLDVPAQPKPMPEGKVHMALFGSVGKNLAKSGMKKETKEMLLEASKAQMRGASPAEIKEMTKGEVQIGMHGKPIAIIPHGDVTVNPRATLTHPERVGGVYKAPRLEEEFPEAMDLTLAPNPELKPRTAYITQPSGSTRGVINVHPNILQDVESAKRIIAHELTHGGALINQGGFGPLSGSDPAYIKSQALLPLLEQIKLASAIRSGKAHPVLTTSLRDHPNFRGLLTMPDERFDDIAQQALVFRSFAYDPKTPYKRTYGEQLANWMMDPAQREIKGVIPQNSPNWRGPTVMDRTRRGRLLSQADVEPSSLLADDFYTLLSNYYSPRR